MLQKLIALILFGVLVLSATGCKRTPEPSSSETNSESPPLLIVSEAEEPTSSAETSAPTAPEISDSSEQQNTSSGETSQTEPQSNSSSPSSEGTKPPTVKPPAPTEPSKPKPEPSAPIIPSEPSEPEPTEPPAESTNPPPDMEKEYERIIRETITYAESYTAKGFTFVWDDSLEFGWETGYMGTPRVKYEGVDGVIGILKRHIDMIVKTATDPGNGIPGYSANYKVMQVTVDGDIAFVVLYG